MFGVKLRCLMFVELDLIPEKVKFYIGPIYARSGVWVSRDLDYTEYGRETWEIRRNPDQSSDSYRNLKLLSFKDPRRFR